ncbi:MAG: gamma-glutamyltransferase, partial [Coxiellaceae bacterium]|nr:gamma-glutamyltransferase [Coxiellaceae bacterium]
MTRLLSFFCALFFISSVYSASPAPAYGDDYMVVTAQKLATNIGNDILRQGGNAVDAAVAIGYALAVVHPCCGNIGGGGFMLIRKKDGTTVFLNFREKAPLAVKESFYVDDSFKKTPYLLVAVPGTVLGLNTALKKYGRLPLKTIIQPAIDLANNGFAVSRYGARLLGYFESSLLAQPNVAAIFAPSGEIIQPEQILKQPELARSLTAIANEGSDAFYRGSIAKQLVQASQQNNGLITEKDLASYSVQELTPITCNYRGYDIITAPPPSAGGVTICQVLNITEQYPLSEMGFHSAKATHITIEAMRQAFKDRSQ